MIFYSIRTKIVFLGLIFIALISAAFLIYSMTTTVNYKQLRLEGIEKTVAYETEKVNKIIAEIEHSAVFYAISGMLCYKAQSEELGEDLVIEYADNFSVLIGGGFWFEPYAFKKDQLYAGFYAFRDKNAVRIDDHFEEYNYHNMVWYREIIENINKPYQVVWARPYVDDSGTYTLMTSAGVGLYDDAGKLIGITTADWEIEEVVRELTAIKPTENSFVILCVPEKDYIISSTRTSETIGLPMSFIPWDITADAFNFNGIDYLRFGKYMDNGWLLSIQIPEKEIFAEVERQNERFSVLIAIVSVSMLLTAYFLISRLINAPIKQLTFDVSKIALGNLDIKIKVNSKDELGLLAQVFKKMTGDLKTSIEEKTKEREEKERISAELNVAAIIQSSMLPCVFPPFPERKEIDLYAAMVPAKEVCGDFFDFFFVDKDNLAVLIADVSGKGVPAALFMVIAKTLIKNCSSCRTPGAVFDTVNKKLCEGNETGMFVTAFIGFYNLPSKKMTFVNAGHNPPLLKKQNSAYEFLNTKPCVVLGFLKETKYHEEEIILEAGETLFLYTDGVTEAMNSEKELFGEERLLAAANKNKASPVHDLITAVKNEVDIFAQGSRQADDITMLALTINGEQLTVNNEQSTENRDRGKENKEQLKSKEITVLACVNNLDGVIRFITKSLEDFDFSSNEKNEICIASEEIFMNIANYAYGQEKGAVCISINSESSPKADALIRFEDTGKPYNPLEQPDPDFNASIAERQVGGLGIFMVKKLMDSVEYLYTGGKNVLLIGKKKKYS